MMTNEATFCTPLEMSAERSEAKQTATLAKWSRLTGGTIRQFAAELR
jgi:hypothetical protein